MYVRGYSAGQGQASVQWASFARYPIPGVSQTEPIRSSRRCSDSGCSGVCSSDCRAVLGSEIRLTAPQMLVA